MEKTKKIFVSLFVLILLSVNVLSFIKQDRDFSEMELRQLASKPQSNAASFINGSYFADMEKYYLDQMFMRDEVVNFKAQFEKVLGVKQRNNVILGKNQHLLPAYGITDPNVYFTSKEKDIAEIVNNMSEIKNVADSKGIVTVRINGLEKSDVYHDFYPYAAPNNYEGTQLFKNKITEEIFKKGINTIEMDQYFDLTDNNSYYYTDHHYNISGALTTYNTLLSYLNDNYEYHFKLRNIEELDLIEQDKMFSGSYSRLLGDEVLFNLEKQSVPNLNIFPKFERFENGVISDTPLITDGEKSSYGNYMGGDKANTYITTNRQELPNILFIGDSFTNAIEVLSILDFNEMHSLDMRHYKASVTDYILSNDIDIIVMVNNTLFTDQFMKGY